MIIAIDGPSGAGKSTVARLLSKKLGYEYIDTGAMYRALAYKAYKQNIDINEANIAELLETTNITYNDNKVFLDGENVENLIRNEEISTAASKISSLKIVREKMVEIQRKIAKNKNVVLEGRDIGTIVFPDAEHKFFITASLEERAKRRYEQLKLNNIKADYTNVINDMIKRDENDSTRKFSPLKPAEDAILIDTTNMDLNEVTKTIAQYIGGSNVL
ncbi:MAG TPA: (d)CMP kinase [Sedimentibacter sp.]|jgi:cytidylate kinase|nr:(d)CMP kinase [Clostridiales bacterium]HOA18901.1 (d)CMP kinase [Sedimentibacter sp.]HPB78980.1 (d)CMP kinase [Sedimentibacter sp.]HPY55965.1 (d)CMP kinase [Sedimentibacter sp.]HQC69650.1 (d)CMP kinase [Sedimentibacter sp.]